MGLTLNVLFSPTLVADEVEGTSLPSTLSGLLFNPTLVHSADRNSEDVACAAAFNSRGATGIVMVVLSKFEVEGRKEGRNGCGVQVQ